MNVFPFTVRSFDTGHYINTPWTYHSTFAKYKPKELSWYAYDIEVISPTRARFVVYDMADFCRGGIGDVNAEFECDVCPEDLKGFISKQVRSMAEDLENVEFNAAKFARVEEIEAEILKAMA